MVRIKKSLLNERDGKKIKGVKVHSICSMANDKMMRFILPKISKTPMSVSQMASRMMEIDAGIRPQVRRLMVSLAKFSAGLMPGKNFKNPNHK